MQQQSNLMPSRAEMFAILEARISPLAKTETLPVSRLCGRVTAQDILSRHALPNTQCASCDGIAFQYEGLIKGTRTWLEGKDYAFCNTGCAIDEQYDTMIEIECVQLDEEGQLSLTRLPEKRGEGIVPAGKQMRAGEVLACAGEQITPSLLGILASGGIQEALVLQKPKVAFLPTGDELVPLGTAPLPPGGSPESNGLMLQAYLAQWGCEAVVFPIVRDDPVALRAAVTRALAEADFVLICAGSSKGTKDYTKSTLAEMGKMLVQELDHGPGKHCSLFMIEGKPIMGLPGPPGGADLTARLYVQAAVRKLLRQPIPRPYTVEAELSKPVSGPPFDFIIRLRLFEREGRMMAEPVLGFGSTRREGYLAANAQFYLEGGLRLQAGDRVLAEWLTEPEYI
ncbi:MAG: molybdopterin molybdotransferase MoeA [Candidatus Pelethousia sp.]|nr:molybdopterin molybdotransferase MoeA [Candidatus Pelethousia sp.]